MAKRCEICGKGPTSGHNVSHSNRKTKRRWYPNLTKVKTVIKGVVKTIKVCVSCLKAGKVLKKV